MSRNVWLALGVLLVGAAAWLVDAMQLSPRATSLEGDARRVEALLASRAAFEVSVLEARAGLAASFDPINRAVTSLRDAAGAAEALQARGAAYAEAAAQLALAARALESEDATLEQLKTDLALLRLASRHFPRAADALMRSADAAARHTRGSRLAGELTTLAALRTEVERYEALPGREGVQRLEEGLSRLQALRASLDEGVRDELDVLAGHTRAILDRRERVDRVARALVRSPMRAHLEAASAVYQQSARGHAQKLGALQVLSAMLALAGVIVLVSLLLRARRHAR